MPFDDIRKHFWQRFNDYREGLSFSPLAFHEQQSNACKRHSEYLARASRDKGFLVVEESPESVREGWTESTSAVVQDNFDEAVDYLLWKNLSKPELAQKIRLAQTSFACDVAIDGNKTFLVIRYR
ncbi:hypothetical protein AUJ65_05040 [Candidatus Micrarchaeota archaeon CG1_02_51_15]|nr:MAG: hypothetical protein AUJ65_05040 [Candidatus Micrarchaeota archaeon CG1_02_51_15]